MGLAAQPTTHETLTAQLEVVRGIAVPVHCQCPCCHVHNCATCVTCESCQIRVQNQVKAAQVKLAEVSVPSWQHSCQRAVGGWAVRAVLTILYCPRCKVCNSEDLVIMATGDGMW